MKGLKSELNDDIPDQTPHFLPHSASHYKSLLGKEISLSSSRTNERSISHIRNIKSVRSLTYTLKINSVKMVAIVYHCLVQLPTATRSKFILFSDSQTALRRFKEGTHRFVERDALTTQEY